MISIIYPCNFGCPNCPYTDGYCDLRRRQVHAAPAYGRHDRLHQGQGRADLTRHERQHVRASPQAAPQTRSDHRRRHRSDRVLHGRRRCPNLSQDPPATRGGRRATRRSGGRGRSAMSGRRSDRRGTGRSPEGAPSLASPPWIVRRLGSTLRRAPYAWRQHAASARSPAIGACRDSLRSQTSGFLVILQTAEFAEHVNLARCWLRLPG